MPCHFRTAGSWKFLLPVLAAWIGLPALPAVAEDDKDEEKITYDDHVQPILRQQCFSCHNADREVGGLDLTSYTNLMEGGSSGPAIEGGSADDSYLFMLVNHDLEPSMPPESEKLSSDVLTTLRRWIDGGALENSGSKPIASKKPKLDFSVEGTVGGRPEGPPPMPEERLALEPEVRTARATSVTAMATNPWSPLVAVGGQRQVLLYHAESLELLGVLPFPEGVPQVLKFSRNGSLLLAGGGHSGFQGLVVIWDVKTGERVTEVGDELDTILAADISADHSRIALGGSAGVVRVYSTADGELLHEMDDHTDWIYSLAFSPDGVLLASSARDGGIFVWEALTGQEYLTLDGHDAAVPELSWRLDSNLLASCSEDGRVRTWEMVDGKQVKNWDAHGNGVESIEFTREGHIVSCGRDNRAKLWDQEGEEIRAFDAFDDLALQVTYCDETERVIAGDWNGAIRVWESEEGEQLGELTPNPPTLRERLDAAEAALAEARAEAEKLAEAAEEAEAKAEKAKAELDKADEASDDLKEKSEKAAEEAGDAREAAEVAANAVAQAETEVERWQDELAFAEQKKKELAEAAE